MQNPLQNKIKLWIYHIKRQKKFQYSTMIKISQGCLYFLNENRERAGSSYKPKIVIIQNAVLLPSCSNGSLG